MSRRTFLTLASVVALGVGGFAFTAPAVLLQSKGVVANPAAAVWMRESGAMLLAVGIVAFAVRAHPDSTTLRALLVGNAVLQAGLFPIEILAYRAGTITELAGIVPNSILHVLLFSGFVHFARVMRVRRRR